MPACPKVHEHPVFQIPSKNQKYEKLVNKLKRFLKSDSGHSIGEYKGYNLSSFKGFPRGNIDERCVFILCKDCGKKVIFQNCSFCGTNEHSMDDAVLIMVGDHKDVYGKTGERIIEQLKGGK